MVPAPNKINSPKLTRDQKSELAALTALQDEEIDTRDIPEQKNWSGAERGALYRSIRKNRTSLPLIRDVE